MPLAPLRRRQIRALACASVAALMAASPAAAQYPQPRYDTPPAAISQAIPREHAAVVDGAGGLYSGPVAGYVSQVGARVAAAAGRDGVCAFHVLNSSVVNAFTSPPGCHVYVTRGLLALINSEDELAAVLGHEIGHVAANHAGRRQRRSAITGIGAAILGALTRSPDIAQIASQAGQLNVLSYSRQQEFEADDLGVRYLAQAGYSPYGLAAMLGALQREDQFDKVLRGREAQQTAAWARTHPLTSDRISRAAQSAAAAGPPPTGGELLGRAAYLRQIDGVVYGDDPRQGLVEDRRFTHPGLRIGFEVPPGFALTNGATAVSIEGPGGVRGQFSVGRMSGGLEEYAYNVMRQTVGQSPADIGAPQRTRIGGFDAVVLSARAQSSSRNLADVVVAAYDDGSGQAYHFVTLSPAGSGRTWDRVIGSFHRLTPREVAEAVPKRLTVVVVRPDDTVQSLSERMAFDDYRRERFMTINGLVPNEPLRPGQRVKLVTRSAEPR